MQRTLKSQFPNISLRGNKSNAASFVQRCQQQQTNQTQMNWFTDRSCRSPATIPLSNRLPETNANQVPSPQGKAQTEQEGVPGCRRRKDSPYFQLQDWQRFADSCRDSLAQGRPAAPGSGRESPRNRWCRHPAPQ